MKASKELILEKYDIAMNRLTEKHIRRFPAVDAELFLISDAYPGVWLEHTYDPVCFALLEPSMKRLPKAQTEIFLHNQKEDGQLPCYVLDATHPNVKGYGRMVGYGQLQECVSFAKLCLETYQLIGDRDYLSMAYDGCARWDIWLRNHRMTMGTGLVELFCEFDTGHDNSSRFRDIRTGKGCPGGDASVCNPEEFMPILAPDVNAVVYGSRKALAEMARLLLRPKAEVDAWEKSADDLKEALMRYCFDPEDAFFYDVDRMGEFRKYRSIHITNLFAEHLLDQPLADTIYNRYLRNPSEFWTPYPFPSMSVSDPNRNLDAKVNNWAYFSQGLTALRTLRWMPYYGKTEDMHQVMKAWVEAVASAERPFTQELDPMTGIPSECSPWYSSCMLFYIASVRELSLL